VQALKRCIGDGLFWLAWLLGPVCWLILYLAGLPLRQSAIAIPVIFYGIFAYPILEEIIFRGAIQSALLGRDLLQRSFKGVSLACVVTSILFALAHLLNQPPLWAAMIFLPSIVFGWARERHQTLYSPIILHMSYNAGFILLFQTG